MDKYITFAKGFGQAGIVCHFAGVQSGDYTLCGTSLDGDRALYEKPAVGPIVYGKVNCPQCKAIVSAIRKIKGNEIEK